MGPNKNRSTGFLEASTGNLAHASFLPQTGVLNENFDEETRVVCGICRDQSVDQVGAVCPTCQVDQARGYRVRSLAGRCSNGAERDHGTSFHAVPLNARRAVCGAEPGRRSAGWSTWRPEGQGVTCPRCEKRLRA